MLCLTIKRIQHFSIIKAHIKQVVGKVLAHKKEVSKKTHELTTDSIQVNAPSQDDGKEHVDLKRSEERRGIEMQNIIWTF